MTSTQKQTEKLKQMLTWRLSDEELKRHVQNYSTLPFRESYRGKSVLIMLVFLGLTALLGLIAVLPIDAVLLGMLTYLPIVFFVSRGHRWAMIVLIILWTLERGYQVFETGSVLPIILWIVITPYFYKAYVIENARRKGMSTPTSTQ